MINNMEEWDELKCIQLIRAYKKKPPLWDPKNGYFFKKSVKEAAWKEIGEELDIPTAICKRKMMILLSSFRREKAKILNGITNDSDPNAEPHPYTSRWFAFKEMAFLMEKGIDKKRRYEEIKLQVLGNHTAEIKKNRIDDRPSRPPKSITTIKQSLSDKLCNLVAAKIVANNKKDLSESPKPGPSKKTVEWDDEITHFTNFIATKMRKYSEATKNTVQNEICQIIFQADQNVAGDNEYEDFTIIESDDDPLNKSVKMERSSISPSVEVQPDSEDSD